MARDAKRKKIIIFVLFTRNDSFGVFCNKHSQGNLGVKLNHIHKKRKILTHFRIYYLNTIGTNYRCLKLEILDTQLYPSKVTNSLVNLLRVSCAKYLSIFVLY